MAEMEGDMEKSVRHMDRPRQLVPFVLFFATVLIVGALIAIWLGGDQTRVRICLDFVIWSLTHFSHGLSVSMPYTLPPQVQVDVGYITTAVSDRVAHYVSSVLSVPGVTNTQMEAFLNTSTVPLAQVGYNQSVTVRDTLVSFVTATASGAALLYLDKDVELYMGMADGMVGVMGGCVGDWQV